MLRETDDAPLSVSAIRAAVDVNVVGTELYERVRRLYPICRSITGDGVRETLRVIGEDIDIQVNEVPTGTPVLDWTVPREWNVRDAYIKNGRGVRIVDFNSCNLHVLNYSVPFHARMSLTELRPHLFSVPQHPDWIPYKTSYYSDAWGFCMTETQLQSLEDDDYEVCIDTSLEDGHLTFGECVLPGSEADEVLFSSHVCHPSLCNDNLSGVSIAVTLARLLTGIPLRYTYRFVFAPGTIGAITWLALRRDAALRVRHGLVLACLGDAGNSTYKRSRTGNAEIDRAAVHVLSHTANGFSVTGFSPLGYDERQYCSPGFNLPVGVLSRTPHGCFPEYHTSADNLELVGPKWLADSLEKCLAIIEILEGNKVYVNLKPHGEPQLGRRGLYATMGGHGDHGREREAALLWTLNLSDGGHSVLDIAEQSGLTFSAVRAAANALIDHNLLEERPVHQKNAGSPAGHEGLGRSILE
jgi:aminopeptidase-like protein